MATTYLKFPMSTNSTTINSVMFFFKTNGREPGTTAAFTLFTIKANGKYYKLRLNPVTGKDDTNRLSVYVGSSAANVYQEKENKKTVNLYQNKILAPFNDLQFKKNQWTFIIVQFINPTASANSYFEITNGTEGVVSNVSNFSYYCLNSAEQVQYVTSNFWTDIDNVNWYNYTSNSLTWQDVLLTRTNSKPIGNVIDIWNSYFGVSTITQVNNATVAETINDIIPLQFGNYEYKTYQDIVKTSKTQSPA
jgi:hypothetical protein